MSETKKRTNSDLYYGLYALSSLDESARKFLETSADRIKGLGKENERLREAFVDLKRSLSAEYAGAINTGVKHSLVNAIDRALGVDGG